MSFLQTTALLTIVAFGAVACDQGRYAHVTVPRGEGQWVQVAEADSREVKPGEPNEYRFTSFCFGHFAAVVWGALGVAFTGVAVAGAISGEDAEPASAAGEEPAPSMGFPFLAVGVGFLGAAALSWLSCSWGVKERTVRFRLQKPGERPYSFTRKIKTYGDRKRSRNNPFTLKVGKY